MIVKDLWDVNYTCMCVLCPAAVVFKKQQTPKRLIYELKTHRNLKIEKDFPISIFLENNVLGEV